MKSTEIKIIGVNAKGTSSWKVLNNESCTFAVPRFVSYLFFYWYNTNWYSDECQGFESIYSLFDFIYPKENSTLLVLRPRKCVRRAYKKFAKYSSEGNHILSLYDFVKMEDENHKSTQISFEKLEELIKCYDIGFQESPQEGSCTPWRTELKECFYWDYLLTSL